MQSPIPWVKIWIYLETAVSHVATKFNCAAKVHMECGIELCYDLTFEILANSIMQLLQNPAFFKLRAAMEWLEMATKIFTKLECEWRSHQVCHRKVNSCRNFVLRRSMIFYCLISFVDSCVWKGHDGCPGGVLSWCSVQISLCQQQECNWPLLYITPDGNNQPYVNVECLIAWSNRHNSPYAYTYSNTWVSAIVQHIWPIFGVPKSPCGVTYMLTLNVQ